MASLDRAREIIGESTLSQGRKDYLRGELNVLDNIKPLNRRQSESIARIIATLTEKKKAPATGEEARALYQGIHVSTD